MSYLVTVRKNGKIIEQFTAIGDRNALMDALYDKHDACCLSLMVRK